MTDTRERSRIMETIRLGSGTGEVTVVERGARVAELRPEPEGPNLLWQGDTAPIGGGDRLWIGPEREVLYDGDPLVRDNWRCPEELDPGTWTADRRAGEVVLGQEALGAVMRRRVRPLTELPVGTDLAWAGCEIDDEVVTDRRWSGWHLTMVDTPARLFVRRARDPLAMYGSPPELEGGWVQATGNAEWKLGFPPPADGRLVLAALGDADPGPLVVLLGSLDPDGTYRDLPPHGEGRPSAIELYDSPGLGFCELEFHFPLEAGALTTTLLGAVGSLPDRLELLERLAGVAS